MFNTQSKDKILFYLLNIVFAALIIFSSFIFLADNESFNIEEILVIGADLTQESTIKNQFSNLIDESILFISKSEIQNKLLTNQFVSEAYIYLLLPNTIILDIKEIVPISLLSINGDDFFIGDNQSFCNASTSHTISIPKIKVDGLSSIDIFFEEPSYDLIKNIYNDNIEFFYFIDSITSSDNKININLKNNSYVIFDPDNYTTQLKYLNSFIEVTGGVHKKDFEYIKFVDSNLIIKGMS